MGAADVSNYKTKLKSAGFTPIKNWEGEDTEDLVGYPRIDGKLYRVTIEQRNNRELTEFCYDFEYFEDGSWPSEWTAAGIPAPSFSAIPGKIDMEEFKENLASWGSYSKSIKLLGAKLSDYAATLRKSGFTESDSSYRSTWEFSKQVQINGQWVKVSIEEQNNREIPEIHIYFRSE
jgi:hypothetical protein